MTKNILIFRKFGKNLYFSHDFCECVIQYEAAVWRVANHMLHYVHSVLTCSFLQILNILALFVAA